MKAADFPETVSAFAADTDRAHAYSTHLFGEAAVGKSVEHYRTVEGVLEIRIAKYRLESVGVVYRREAKSG